MGLWMPPFLQPDGHESVQLRQIFSPHQVDNICDGLNDGKYLLKGDLQFLLDRLMRICSYRWRRED